MFGDSVVGMRLIFKKIAVLGAVALAAACTVKYPVVGYFNDFNEVFLGDVNHDLNRGTAFIEVKAENSGIRCAGDSRVNYIPASNYVAGALLIPYCEGQKGTAMLTCDDGRVIRANWTADSCTAGYGYGSDQNGARFEFAFGLPKDQALARFNASKEEAKKKPTFPIYGPGGSEWAEGKEIAGYSGTGFLIAPGKVVTNHHVVEGATRFALWIDGVEIPATLTATDEANDLALLTADIDGTPFIVPASPNPEVADEVAALGFPQAYSQGTALKATFGRVNALSGFQDNPNNLQMDAPLQPGNSGGPLIDTAGRLIGVNVSTLRESQNVNFAIKTTTVLPMVDDLRMRRSGSYSGFKKAINAYKDSVYLIVAE